MSHEVSLLAIAGWFSTFALVWALILGKVERDWLAFGFLIFFFCVAIISSALLRSHEQR